MAAPTSPRQPCVLASCLILRLSSAASVYMLITCFLLLLSPTLPSSISLLFFWPFSLASFLFRLFLLLLKLMSSFDKSHLLWIYLPDTLLQLPLYLSLSLSRPRTEQICCNFLLQLRLQICALHEKRYKSCHSKKNIERGTRESLIGNWNRLYVDWSEKHSRWYRWIVVIIISL